MTDLKENRTDLSAPDKQKPSLKDRVTQKYRQTRQKTRKSEQWILEKNLPAPAGILIVLLGIVVIAAGVAMLVLPGQGILTIILGVIVIRIGFTVFRGTDSTPSTQENK